MARFRGVLTKTHRDGTHDSTKTHRDRTHDSTKTHRVGTHDSTSLVVTARDAH
jgi:hypothetical protein